MSKAFVIKNKEGKYLAVSSSDYERYWTTIDFAHYFRFLNGTHDAKAEAEDYRNTRYPECEVVEITIAEGDLEQQLAEKDQEIKQLTSIEKDNKEYIRKLESTLDTYAKRTPIMSQVKIRNLQVDVEELKLELEKKNKEIAELKKPKKYVYNCLSFVSNSDATEVAKYIEDLHQTIAQNNEELDEYVKRIAELEREVAEKDKEVDITKKLLESYKQQCHNFLENEEKVRHYVCEDIRELAKNYVEMPICENCGEQIVLNDVVLTGNDLVEILNQIEKEGKDDNNI